ncbi:hypothetical protein QAD02_009882 [Eretmocerus hayati]|uniref:Uncharacterized protein n=1 Tax=Eretmocerus hayati TaxID=131215 RepID=A0ACC2NAZ1_9HYME|nr:hypothetical protein QAD02_009882 [Eretmocerus hayati]
MSLEAEKFEDTREEMRDYQCQNDCRSLSPAWKSSSQSEAAYKDNGIKQELFDDHTFVIIGSTVSDAQLSSSTAIASTDHILESEIRTEDFEKSAFGFNLSGDGMLGQCTPIGAKSKSSFVEQLIRENYHLSDELRKTKRILAQRNELIDTLQTKLKKIEALAFDSSDRATAELKSSKSEKEELENERVKLKNTVGKRRRSTSFGHFPDIDTKNQEVISPASSLNNLCVISNNVTLRRPIFVGPNCWFGPVRAQKKRDSSWLNKLTN